MNGVLVDTSVWVHHFRHGESELTRLLGTGSVMTHPLVLGEIACGTPPDRSRTLADIASLQPIPQATFEEALAFVERERLYGLGCGWVDVLLLTSTLMAPGVKLWTRDQRLHALAQRFSVAHSVASH